MHTPTQEQAEGYDVLIWLDDHGDIMMKAYTREGHEYFETVTEDYVEGALIEISDTHPEELAEELPPTLRAGFVNPDTSLVYPLPKARKH